MTINKGDLTCRTGLVKKTVPSTDKMAQVRQEGSDLLVVEVAVGNPPCLHLFSLVLRFMDVDPWQDLYKLVDGVVGSDSDKHMWIGRLGKERNRAYPWPSRR